MPQDWLQPNDNSFPITTPLIRPPSNHIDHSPNQSALNLSQSDPCKDNQTNEEKNPQSEGYLSVRGHLSVSLLPFSSPTLPLSICIPHPYLCSISNDHTYSQRLPGLTVRRLSRSWLTNSRRLPTSHSAHTLATSDEPQTHWDRSMWHYGTLRNHVDTQLWEAWW
jgi:hypothetical protein